MRTHRSNKIRVQLGQTGLSKDTHMNTMRTHRRTIARVHSRQRGAQAGDNHTSTIRTHRRTTTGVQSGQTGGQTHERNEDPEKRNKRVPSGHA